MKSLISFLTPLFMVAVVTAQTVTVKFNGQRKQVAIDGKVYTPVQNTSAGTSASDYNLQVVATDLVPGSHTLVITRNNNDNTRRNTNTTFILRNNYNLEISVANNGSVIKKETYAPVGSSGSAMSNAQFNLLMQDVRNTTRTLSKFNIIKGAFENTENHFTTSQVRRLVQSISGDALRMQLAKSAVPQITDIRNASSLSNLFTTQANRNAYIAFVRDFRQSGSTTAAMSDARFNSLYNDIRSQWRPGEKLDALNAAFASTTNRFTTRQVIQLIQLLGGENERVQLAKAAYRTVVDPANYTQVYSIIDSQAGRDDIANYIRTGGTGTYTPPVYRTPMSDANFSTLLGQIRGQWLPGAKKSAVLEAFSNTNNNFTAYQAAQLIMLDNDEADRMDMAKASIRSIVDMNNISVVYNVFPSQARKDEIAAYVSSYSTTYGSGTTGTTYPTAMADATFSVMLEDTRGLWLPGATKARVTEIFSTPNTYFSTAQAYQLIALDNDEPDRLDMAKASYRTIVDRQNFSQVYKLFTNQNYINELAAYIRTIQ